MYRRITLLLFAILAVGILSAASGIQPAAAQDATGVTVTITAGFDQHIKTGTWFPVKVLLENNGPQMIGQIILWFDDGMSGGPQFSYPVDLPSISRKEITMLLYASSWNSSLNWRLVDSDGKTILIKKANLVLHSEQDAMYGVVAANPTPLNQLTLIDPAAGSASLAIIQFEDLPDNSRGLESLSILVLCGVDTGGMSADQARSLAEWVQYGGNLILCGGPDWQKTLAGLQANEPTRSMLPLTQIQTVSVETEGGDLNSIVDLLPAGSPPLSAGGSELTVIATGNMTPGTQLLAADSQGRPLVATRQLGNGNVIYLSADPTIPPFSTWTGLEQFFRALLDNSQRQPDWSGGITQWWNAVTAAQSFSTLGMPPVLLICGFLFVYMLILGPANYLLLRLLNRRELGWITTPILIIVITLSVFVIGSLTRTGKPIMNRLALVQVWPSKAGADNSEILARVDGVVGIYSPARATYQVDFDRPFVAHVPTTDNAGISPMDFTQDGEHFSVKDVRIDVSGISTLGVEGSISLNNFPYELTASQQAGTTNLTGTFTNASTFLLEDAVIISSSQTWTVGDIQPGQSISIDLTLNGSAAGGLSPNTTKPINPSLGPVAPVYGYSNPMDAILGTSDYWRDRETYRRYNFISSFLFNSYYGYGYMQFHGIYLAAWSKDQVIPASVAGRTSDGEDTTLFLIALTPDFVSTEAEMILDPGMFNWVEVETTNNPASPYNMYLYSEGHYILEFSPAFNITFSRVRSLTFTLEAMNAASAPNLDLVHFSLFNYSNNAFEQIANVAWGDNEIAEPEKYVSPNGSIRIMIESELGYLELGRTDFTMVIER